MLRHFAARKWWYVVTAVLILTAPPIALKLYSLRRESQIRMCKSHINYVSYSIHAYNAKYNRLPPAVVYDGGIAMHSWRVLILEVCRPDLFVQYRLSEPWNSPHNSLLANQMPQQYQCGVSDDRIPPDHTTFVAVVGSDTVMRTDKDALLRLEDVPKDKVILVELPKRPRHWMSPDDASPDEISEYFRTIVLNSTAHDHYVRSDGLVRPVRELSAAQLADRMRVE
jgi:hypothetical protein